MQCTCVYLCERSFHIMPHSRPDSFTLNVVGHIRILNEAGPVLPTEAGSYTQS